MGKLEGKVAVVTGSSRGIGRAIAVALAAEGAKVVINGRPSAEGLRNPVEDVVAEITGTGHQAVASLASVADRGEAESIIQTAIDSFGRLDILVNNAGIVRDRMIWNMTDEEWDQVIKTHLYGSFYCARAAIRWMRRAIRDGRLEGGRIINIAANAGVSGSAGQPNYSAAKGGIISLTYSCAAALEGSGITCNMVIPRAATRMIDTIPEDRLRARAVSLGLVAKDKAQELTADALKELYGKPEDIAPAVCWLASDESSHVNGQAFHVTRGKIGLLHPMYEAKTAFTDGKFRLDQLEHIMPEMTRDLSQGC